MNKKVHLALLLVMLIGASYAQENSELGYFVPTEGTMRILVVYAQVDYGVGGCASPGDTYGVNSEWPTGGAPYWETSGGSYVTAKPLFDYDLPITAGTLTDYYHQASLGEQTILGDYINLVIPCTASGLSGSGNSSVINALENIPTQITTANGKHLSDFDLFNGNSKGLQKNSGADNKIDCLFIIWKNNSYATGVNCSAGFGVDGYYSYQVTDQGTQFTFPIVSTWGGCDWDGTFYTFTAEFLHGLLGGNNWHMGGGAGPYTFMTPPKTLCTSAQYDNQTNMFCGWDRNHLGWKGNKNYLISALNISDVEVQTDLVQPSPSGPFEITYRLRDFSCTGDVVRIKLPHIDWSDSGDPKNQYLWIENHQMISNFDHSHFQDDFDATHWEPGMFAYIQVGKDRKLGLNSSDDIFDDSPYDPLYPNSLGSWIMPLTSEGNYDFNYRFDLIDYWCGFGNGTFPRLPLEKSSSVENPLTGCSDIYHFYDYDNNGKVISPSDGADLYRGEALSNAFVCSMQGYGDEEDTWNLGSGKTKIGITTNPATSTILTLKANTFYDNPTPPSNISFETYDNRIIHLNNLSIEIIDEEPNSSLPLNIDGGVPNDLIIKVKWDDVNVTDDIRWCAPDIYLHPTIHEITGNLDDPNEYALNITAGNSIALDRGQSPTQHVAFEGSASTEWIFTQPTVMTCLPNSYFHLDSGSDLIIKNGSTLIMQTDSKLEVHDGSHVYVEDGSTLIIEDGATLYIWDDGLVHVKPGGTLIVRNSTANKGIFLDTPPAATYSAELKVEGTLSFEDGADFLYQGTGFYHFAGTPVLNLSTGSDVVWIGSGQGNKMVELNNSVVLNIDGHPTTIKTGMVLYHDNSRLEIENTSLDIFEANFDGTSSTPVGTTGIYGNQLITKCDIKYFNFTDLATGIELRYLDDPLQVNIENGKFENVTTAISGYHVDKMIMLTCSAEDPTVAGSRGLSLASCKYVKLDESSSIKAYDIGAYLVDVKALYLDHSSTIVNAATGIYSTDSKVFMRRGSTIDQSVSVAAEMYGTWNSTTNNYSSMLTMGDKGCAGIIRSIGQGVIGTNTVLSIDAVTHDQNDDNNGYFDHVWFVRAIDNTEKLFDICYTQTASPVTLIRARRNLWCPAGAASNPAPAASAFSFINTAACSPPGSPSVTFDRTPLSVCIPATYNCSTCDETLKVGEGTSEDGTVTVAAIVTDAFSEAYADFIVTDDDATRVAFTDLSVLTANYDASIGQWSVTTLAGVVLPAPDSIVNLIMVAKILQEEPDSGVEKIATGANDIFAEYYWELLHGSTDKIPLFTVYPNPAEDKINVELKDFSGIVKITLVDLSGRMIYSEIIDGQQLSIDLSNIPGGLYLVKGERKDGGVSEVQTIAVQ